MPSPLDELTKSDRSAFFRLFTRKPLFHFAPAGELLTPEYCARAWPGIWCAELIERGLAWVDEGEPFTDPLTGESIRTVTLRPTQAGWDAHMEQEERELTRVIFLCLTAVVTGVFAVWFVTAM
jgi:hypothetical protein